MGCKNSRQLSEISNLQNESSKSNNETSENEAQNENHFEKNNGVQSNNKQMGVSDARLLRKTVSFIDEAKKNEPKLVKIKKDPKTRELIRNAFLNNEFLNYLVNDERMELIIDVMYSKELETNTFIIKEGDIGSHLYVCAYGLLEVFDKNNTSIKKINVGEAFGELAILYEEPRQASVKVITPSVVWVLDRTAFHDIIKQIDIKKHEENMKFLQACLVFQHVPMPILSKITDIIITEFFKSGSTIIRQGDIADKFYIIKAGTASVTTIKENGEEVVMGTLSTGEYFGEIALQKENAVRKATIQALDSGVECLTLDGKSFLNYLGNLDGFKGEKYTKNSTHIIDNAEYAYMKLEDLVLVHKLQYTPAFRTDLVQFKSNIKLTFALKKIPKEILKNNQTNYHSLLTERDLLMNSESIFLRKLYRTFQDKRYLYMLLEPCLGGNLWLTLQRKGQFNEDITKFMAASVILAFEYLHDKYYVYRDLKPENLMIDSKGYIKLVDFTFVKCIPDNSKTWSFVGTPEYLTPEVLLNRGHNNAVDIWALGIFIHELLVGYTPFRGKDSMSTYNKILKGIKSVIFSVQISNTAQDLITKLCHPVSTERLGCSSNGIEDIKYHRWFDGFDWAALKEGTLPAPLINVTKNNQDVQYMDIVDIYENEAPEVDWNVEF